MTKTKTQQDIHKALSKLTKIDPIAYLFVMTAIDNHCSNVLADEEGTIKAMERSFVSGEAWVRTAKDLRKSVAA